MGPAQAFTGKIRFVSRPHSIFVYQGYRKQHLSFKVEFPTVVL